MKLTQVRLDALRVLAKADKDGDGPMTGGVFAALLWPEKWAKAGTKERHGMGRSGGSFLYRLHKDGLAKTSRKPTKIRQYAISAKGKKVLAEAELEFTDQAA